MQSSVYPLPQVARILHPHGIGLLGMRTVWMLRLANMNAPSYVDICVLGRQSAWL